MILLYDPFRKLPCKLSPCRRFFASHPAAHTATDFAHHKKTARLNHGSFGATPRPVLEAQDEFRRQWLAQPDEMYFSGELHERMRQAAIAGATTLSPSTTLCTDEICLLENATVATCAVAYHWSKMIQTGDVIVYLDVAYRACIHILKEYCERVGAKLVPLTIPFPATTEQEILSSLRAQLESLVERKLKPKFAFLDHVSSQPSILLPIAAIIRLVRQYGDGAHNRRVQVCVDAAHAVGSVQNLDITQYDCDYYYSNLHKWGFAPPTASIFWARSATEMRHPITSWAWGQGLAADALFTGTRDYSAMAAVPVAVDYLRSWRSSDGQTSSQYCHRRVLEAAQFLRNEWGTSHLDSDTEDSLVATQAMVRLPTDLHVTDRPGQVTRGVRDRLRDDYNIEASVGCFGSKGNYLRLSWAVYTTNNDIERLAKAVIDITESQ